MNFDKINQSWEYFIINAFIRITIEDINALIKGLNIKIIDYIMSQEYHVI